MNLYSWGANNYGQLGVGFTNEQCSSPTEVVINDIVTDNIRFISGGGGHTFILDNDGFVYGCGLNTSCQLGLRDVDSLSEFKRIWQLDKYQISGITCGWNSSFAITKNNKALCFGSNLYCQLGFCNIKLRRAEEPLFLDIDGVVQISSGLRHTAILLDNGKVLMSGHGKKGQLGITENDQPLLQSSSFIEVPFVENIQKIACGQNFTIALTRDGDLLCWGDNKHGQLGFDPSLHQNIFKPTRVETNLYLNNISHMEAGWTHSVLCTGEGNIINFGRNSYGQLGMPNENRTKPWIPQYLNLNKKVKHLAVGSEHNFIKTDEGELWSWGWNEHGNCGIDTDTNIFKPTKINIPGNSVLIGTGSAHCFALVA